MNLSSGRAHEEPEISLTSLIDVVFTLIIFFVITTTFEPQTAIQLDLPKASVEQTPSPTEPLVLAIDPQGRYFIGDSEVLKRDPASLKAALAEAAGDDRDQAVVVRADAQTPHQGVVTALDVLGQLGFARISIATVGAEEADKQ